ncbi:uncharacterized protein LOC134244333 [Saccostrea cucullata]|uniref:uncharacterized protein LOC134244333 n=1 Tax=Saccostrea cuccullata TaxID=36930 RepID=UPI002ED01E1E
MSNYKIGVNLRVTENSNQGGRKYMEDNNSIQFVRNDEGGYEFAYFGIFDGHGGSEASKFVRDHLLNQIKKYDSFWNGDDEQILAAIKNGFLDTQELMWKEVGKWSRTASGHPSTSGTTGSIAIIKNSKLYIGHVGDSGVALGYEQDRSEKRPIPGVMLTQDHKPDSPEEIKRIRRVGGQVVAKAGVQRVVWNRPNISNKGPVRRSTPIDKIPFLAVARSLGDLWSFNYQNNEYVVSPVPDVAVHELDPAIHRCLILGSDGLWNMMTAEAAASMVADLENHFEYKVIHDPSVPVSYWINPAEKLVQKALHSWRAKLMKADNTSCIVVLIDPLGPRKLSILKRKREEYLQKIAPEKSIASSSTRTSPRKHDTASKPENVKSVKEEENKKKLTSRVNPHSVATKTVISSVSTEKSKRLSLHSAVNTELDDSIQANSVHFKATLVQGTCAKEKLNFSCSNVFARFKGSKSDLDVNTSTQGVPITRARHHSGNVILQSHKVQKSLDQNQKPVKNQIFTASSLKDLSVLTDSLKPYQTNRVHITEKGMKKVEPPISACSLKDVQNFMDCGKSEIKVRTNSDMNQRASKEDGSRKDLKVDTIIKGNSTDCGGHFLRRHSVGAIESKKASCVASKLRKGKQRSLRCRGQVENKVKASATTIAGVKRKRNSIDNVPQTKKACRR